MIQAGCPTRRRHRRPGLPVRGRVQRAQGRARRARDGERRPEHERLAVLHRHRRRVLVARREAHGLRSGRPGLDVVDRISLVERDARDRPATPSRSTASSSRSRSPPARSSRSLARDSHGASRPSGRRSRGARARARLRRRGGGGRADRRLAGAPRRRRCTWPPTPPRWALPSGRRGWPTPAHARPELRLRSGRDPRRADERGRTGRARDLDLRRGGAPPGAPRRDPGRLGARCRRSPVWP